MIENIFTRESAVESGLSLWVMGYLAHEFNLLNVKDVYHYTDVNGFISIIQNKEFWLSHIRFMNDREEYLEGYGRCNKIIEKLKVGRESHEIDFLNKVMNKLNCERSSGFFTRSSKDVFSLSLSTKRDSLDLWRGYGRNSGISIGFDKQTSTELVLIRKEYYESVKEKHKSDSRKKTLPNSKLFVANNVIYEDDVKDKILLSILEISLERLNFLRDKKDETAEISAMTYATDVLFEIIPYMKNKGFENEAECRIVENSISDTQKPIEIFYRERNGIILPYIKYVLVDRNYKTLKNLPIKEIVVGPGLNQKDVIESVKYFLEKQGLEELIDKVVASKIPYVAN